MLVLIVEDIRCLSEALEAFLGFLGHKSIAVNDGVMAIKQLETGVTPDLIICDDDMPYMTGIELIGILKDTPKWANIPIIFSTASNKRSDLADGHVRKPYDLNYFDEIIKDISQKRLTSRH